MRGGLRGLDSLSTLFSPDAEAPDNKKGAAAEAGRPSGDVMLQRTTNNRISQSISDTVSIEIDHERTDKDYERTAQWLDRVVADSQKRIISQEVTISPVLADLILKRNPDNRAVRKARVAEMRADLENGHFALNGEPVILSREGLLNDGQHRLHAIRESGISLRTLMVFGVTRSSRLTVDQGGARTAADYLGMQGKADNALVVAAVARLVWQWQRYNTIDLRGNYARQPTKTEIIGVAADHESEIKHSINCVGKGWRFGGSKSLLAFVHWLLARTDLAAATHFVSAIIEGANLDTDNPIYVLRQRFFADPKMSSGARFEAILRAWNAVRRRQPLQKIQIMGRLPKIEG